MSGLHVVAVDASAYAIRAIVTGEGHELVHALECKPHELQRAAKWIGRIAEDHAELRVVGSPLDDWPAGLEQELRLHGITVDWISPRIMRSIFYPLQAWNRRRRLHRARLLAFLAKEADQASSTEAVFLARQWERQVAEEILNDL